MGVRVLEALVRLVDQTREARERRSICVRCGSEVVLPHG